MSVTFRELLQMETRNQLKEGSQKAVLLTKVKAKALKLKSTIAVRANEYISEESLNSIEDAADNLIDEWVNELLEGSERTSTRTSKGLVGVTGLRDSGGRYISILNLERLLQISLHEYIESLMGAEGRLNYITGRLAHSANITSITKVRDKVSLMFTYMVYPYATFEPGGKQYLPDRSPSDLIDTALNKALSELLNKDSASRFITKFAGGI